MKLVSLILIAICHQFQDAATDSSRFALANFNDDDALQLDGLCSRSLRQERQGPCANQRDSKYRSSNGVCNNLRHPSFGASSTVYQRIIKTLSPSSSYADGRSSVRRSINGRDLPSARLISTSVFTNENRQPHNEATILIMFFGQFTQHGLTHITNVQLGNGVRCCVGGIFGRRIEPSPHAECLPIEIPPNDRLYNQRRPGEFNCHSFVRSQFVIGTDGVREQINTHTHWMDVAQIYGNGRPLDDNLRDRSSGRGLLRTSNSFDGRQLMPQIPCPGNSSCSPGSSCACFVAGDDRMMQNPGLITLHTIWLREHNRIAQQLFRMVPGRSDEFYYQEARRLVIAQYQHIFFTEFLPLFIGGARTARVMNVRVHDQDANPAIFTEFSTAAFRAGHSNINTFMRLFERNGKLSDQSYFMGDEINSIAGPHWRPNNLLTKPTFMDNLLRGLLRTYNERADDDFASFITGQLFKSPPGPGVRLGLDLAAVNIQRGRDHGLPSYAHFWALSQGVPLVNFQSLASTTPANSIAKLRSVYGDDGLMDIDLYVGGLTERPEPGALVGPTFAFIIEKQFENIKRSDPFFYNLLNQRGSFNQNQLAEVEKSTLSRIICDNSDGTISSIQPNAFKIPLGLNQPVACNRLASIDFRTYTASL